MAEFNPSKSILVNVSLNTKKSNLKLFLKDIPVNQGNEHNHLGIVLSNDLDCLCLSKTFADPSVADAPRQAHFNPIDNVLFPYGHFIPLESLVLTRGKNIIVFTSVIRLTIEYGSILYDLFHS